MAYDLNGRIDLGEGTCDTRYHAFWRCDKYFYFILTNNTHTHTGEKKGNFLLFIAVN